MRRTFEFSVSAPIEAVVETYKSTDFFIETMKLAGARSIEIVEEEALLDGGRRWRARITEVSKLPDFLKTSDIMVIINESEFHPEERKLNWRIMPNISQRMIRLCGTIQIVEDGARTKLVYSVDLEIKIPLFGRKTEAIGIEIIGRECSKQAGFLGECAASPDMRPNIN